MGLLVTKDLVPYIMTAICGQKPTKTGPSDGKTRLKKEKNRQSSEESSHYLFLVSILTLYLDSMKT